MRPNTPCTEAGPIAVNDPPANPVPVALKPPSTEAAQALVAQLNKHLNDSGRPDQFRVDPSSGNKVIQQINPANGEVRVVHPNASAIEKLRRHLGLNSQYIAAS